MRGVLSSLRYAATVAVGAVTFGAVAVGALGGVSGAVANPADSFSTGAVQLSEGVGSTTCLSTGITVDGSAGATDAPACDAIDDLGAAMDRAPGGAARSTTIVVSNVGSVDTAAASLAAGRCSATAAADDGAYAGADVAGFCGTVDLTISNLTPGARYRCIYPVLTVAPCATANRKGTLATLAGTTLTNPGLSTLAAGASATYVVTVRSDRAQSNADQGLAASLPLTWTISQ
jgi:hypothetical protein